MAWRRLIRTRTGRSLSAASVHSPDSESGRPLVQLGMVRLLGAPLAASTGLVGRAVLKSSIVPVYVLDRGR